MTAYAIAHLRNPGPHPDLAEYFERVRATLDPHQGRFLVHSTEHQVLEGVWPGAVVVIEFPGLAEARAWYASEAYAQILPLRTRHIDGNFIIVDGVPMGYDPVVTAKKLRAAIEVADSGPPDSSVR